MLIKVKTKRTVSFFWDKVVEITDTDVLHITLHLLPLFHTFQPALTLNC